MKLRRFGLPTVVLCSMLAFAACGADTEPSGDRPDGSSENQSERRRNSSSSRSSTEEAIPADVAFARMMIPHHAQAIEMAEMVPDRDVSKELLQLAREIEAAQQPEIDQLTGMLRDWGEDAPDAEGGDGAGDAHESDGGHDGHDGHEGPGGHGGMEGMMSDEDMESLRNANDREFERIWLEMMVEHHEGAVMMSEKLLADGKNPEARKLAREVIDAQDREIDQMNQMLDDLGS